MAAAAAAASGHRRAATMDSAMFQGTVFSRFMSGTDGKAYKQKIFLFLKDHVLYWGDHPETSIASPLNKMSKLPLSDLSDVYVGKHTKIFESRIGKLADEDKCMSLVGELLSLNLEADSAEVISEWLEVLEKVLSRAGSEVETKEVEDGEKAHMNRQTQEERLAEELEQKKLEEQGTRMLSDGCVFTRYLKVKDENGNDSVSKAEILVFFAPGGGRSGSLYWCDSGGPQSMSPSRSMPLEKVTDIFIGKCTKTFEIEPAKAAVEDHCCSLLSEKVTLNLEAGSEESLSLFLAGIQHILKEAGQAVVQNELDDMELELSRRNSNFRSAKSKTGRKRSSIMVGGNSGRAKGGGGGPDGQDEILYSGWLHKKSPALLKGFQRRFFVLSKNSLTYYKTEKDAQRLSSVKGSISFRQVRKVQHVLSPIGGFNIVPRNEDARLYELKAADDASRDAWVREIDEALRDFAARNT